MSKEKIIEEIARDFNNGMCSDREVVESCAECVGASEHCVLYKIATRIYNAGYRKQAKRFIVKKNGDIVPLWNGYGKWAKEHRFSRNYDDFFRYICSRCGRAYDEPSNFCPNCGAKMKGGAE